MGSFSTLTGAVDRALEDDGGTYLSKGISRAGLTALADYRVSSDVQAGLHRLVATTHPRRRKARPVFLCYAIHDSSYSLSPFPPPS